MRSFLSLLASGRGLAVAVSCGAGVLLGLLVRINATLGEHLGIFEATFVIHLVGTVFAVLLLTRRLGRPFLRQLRRAPRYELAGGLFGVAMVALANLVVPPLGVALAVSLFITADLLASSAADHVGLFGLRRLPLTGRRLLGLLLVVAGVLLIRWG